ncbi:MAG TPA: (2Fe-2S)-binding protein [Bacteriovoracaceae bacterium]|nr:(2Fe-2S)-binding protein [Bacteriovoracaceae bacterium]
MTSEKGLFSGKENPYAELYDPGRFTPFKSAPKFIQENANVFSQMAKDYLGKKDRTAFADIAPGEGKVVAHEGHKMAVYKDEENKVQVCSAICTHMGCVVHWNDAETSWDCPCHGSRFATKGEVLEGPALKALAKMDELTENYFLRSVKTIEKNLFMGPEAQES